MLDRRRALRRARDDAVSPVIAVILMVAITVVIAATVYVWVTGFQADGRTAARAFSVTGQGPVADCGGSHCKTYVVASSTPGFRYDELSFRLEGATLAFGTGCTPTADREFAPCRDNALVPVDSLVVAGDHLVVRAPLGALVGKDLRVLDTAAGSLVYSTRVT